MAFSQLIMLWHLAGLQQLDRCQASYRLQRYAPSKADRLAVVLWGAGLIALIFEQQGLIETPKGS